ncbi:MAG: 4-hydroxyphenylacetate 3-hydroxylase family protein [Gammaproteobacteria bacterium]|uniref:4-hydroxyphenylacetate 3-hydroxylase family protein n=1 Tax=Bradyrhizobium sp. TaxID=376 RepID=UPI003D0C13DF
MSVRTGAQYVRGLKDGREVYFGTERVDDVTEFPAFRGAIGSIASLYDLQQTPANRDVMVAGAEGFDQPVARAFEFPRTPEHLRLKRETYVRFAEATCGMMGRSPDFLNAMVTALAAKRSFFARMSDERAQAIVDYHRHVAENDLFLTHALLDPQLDKSRARHEQSDPGICLRITGRSSEGLVLNGIKRIATAAPFADELFVWPFPPTFRPGEEAYANVFAIPMNTPGLRTLCRPSFAHLGDRRDYPLASRFDEMDTTLVFENVVVPWDRVFLHENIELLNCMYRDTRMRELTAHQTNARLEVKLGFVYALLLRMAEAQGIETRPDVMEMLGEAAVRVEVIRSTTRSAEFQARVDEDNGILYPYLPALQTGRALGPVYYPEMVAMVRRLGGGGLVQLPVSMRDFDSPLGVDLERSLRGAQIPGTDKAQLLKLAWDVCGSEFAARHELYEMNYAGERSPLVAGIHREYPRRQACLDHLDSYMATL